MPRLLIERYNIEITINGEPVNWDHFMIEEYSMHESVRQKYPTAELSFACTAYYILVNPIIDGTPIVVTVEDTQIRPSSPPQTYRMRAFNTKFRSTAQLFKYYVSLYLDAMDLHTARIKSYGKTTSSNAIAAAAADAGLAPECDPAADVQVWLRRNVRGSDFIYKTAAHSYAGPLSCFVTGIGATHILRHYNIHERYGRNSGWVFKNLLEERYAPGPQEILYEDAIFKTVSGTNNSYIGYGRTSGTYNLEKGFQNIKANVASAFQGAFQVSKQLMGPQRGQTLAFDSDNTHSNYAQAGVQNETIKGLFSVHVEIVTRFGRHPLLLDYVQLEPHAMGLNDITQGGIITPWAGGYYISEIHTLVTPYAVAKKYVLLREGLNFGNMQLGLLGEIPPAAPSNQPTVPPDPAIPGPPSPTQ